MSQLGAGVGVQGRGNGLKIGLLALPDGGTVKGKMNRVSRQRRAVFGHVVETRYICQRATASQLAIQGIARAGKVVWQACLARSVWA